jgi:serine/threonine protein kinase
VEARVGKVAVSGRYHRAPRRIDDDYQLTQDVLGSGYNGVVRKAVSTGSSKKQQFAVKAFKFANVPQDKRPQLEAEVEIFLSMDHPHVTRLFDVYESVDYLHLVMECMEGGELFDRITAKKKFQENDAAEAVFQMLLALNYIHSHGIVHRDIKLENFLYDFKDSDHLKLIDFGFSKVWDPNVKMRVSCGTLSYVAPEVLKQSYTSKCDLWSLGVITFILLAGYMPFSGSEKSQTQNIQGGLYSWKPERWSKVSPEAIEFVKSLLKVSVDQRLSAQQALEHQWIAKRKQKKSAAIDDSVVDALRNFGKASKFRRCCLEMMAWSLSNEERAKVRQYFIQMDKNHQGTITLAELKEVLTEKFHIADEESNAIFAAMDTNNDEEIHYSDFLAAMVSTRIALHDDLLLRAFKRFDVDNSGYITADNLREVLGDSFEGEEIEKLIKEADALNDGRISYQEFVSYLRGEPLDTHKLAAEKFLDNQIKAQDSEREKKMRLRGSQENAVKKQPERGDPAKQVCCCVS